MVTTLLDPLPLWLVPVRAVTARHVFGGVAFRGIHLCLHRRHSSASGSSMHMRLCYSHADMMSRALGYRLQEMLSPFGISPNRACSAGPAPSRLCPGSATRALDWPGPPQEGPTGAVMVAVAVAVGAPAVLTSQPRPLRSRPVRSLAAAQVVRPSVPGGYPRSSIASVLVVVGRSTSLRHSACIRRKPRPLMKRLTYGSSLPVCRALSPRRTDAELRGFRSRDCGSYSRARVLAA